MPQPKAVFKLAALPVTDLVTGDGGKGVGKWQERSKKEKQGLRNIWGCTVEL